MHSIRHAGRRAIRLLPCLLLAAAVAQLTACRRQLVYYDYRPTPMEGWEQGDTLHYHIDTLRHSARLAMSLGVRSSASTPYPFQTLWLVVRQHWHNPETMRCDTVECRLTSADGDVQGTGVSIYQVEQPFLTFDAPEGASADISICHIMRREMLQGITDIGVRLERAD